MASILDRYGIKEVADVTFYEINSDGTPGKPVLFLDTLKVSTIEQTAQTAEARGGKGNPQLISWDYGKDITLTMEDALFSPKSLSIMMANGSVNTATESITKTAVLPLGAADDSDIVKAARDYIIADIYDENEGSKRVKLYCGTSSTIPEGEVALGTNITISDTLYSENGATIDSAFTKAALQSIVSTGSTGLSSYAGQNVMFKYTVRASTKTLEVSADKFPGTYYIVGDTYSRSDTTGKDQFFQFIVPKAKLKAEQTITLQAEGDPSTFNMNLTVLRPDDGVMMKLKQYDLVENVAPITLTAWNATSNSTNVFNHAGITTGTWEYVCVPNTTIFSTVAAAGAFTTTMTNATASDNKNYEITATRENQIYKLPIKVTIPSGTV